MRPKGSTELQVLQGDVKPRFPTSFQMRFPSLNCSWSSNIIHFSYSSSTTAAYSSRRKCRGLTADKDGLRKGLAAPLGLVVWVVLLVGDDGFSYPCFCCVFLSFSFACVLPSWLGDWDPTFQRLSLRHKRSLDPWCFTETPLFMVVMIEKYVGRSLRPN
jgi:hypothetical protein